MKQAEILKELKGALSQMDDCIVGAWNESLSETTDAVVLNTMHSDKYGKEVECEYNGWRERLYKLVKALEEYKEPTRMEVMVSNFHNYISMDDDTTEKHIVAEIELLQTHRAYKDEHDTLDHVLSERFCPVECFEHNFTVGEFLNHIDTKGYE